MPCDPCRLTYHLAIHLRYLGELNLFLLLVAKLVLLNHLLDSGVSRTFFKGTRSKSRPSRQHLGTSILYQRDGFALSRLEPDSGAGCDIEVGTVGQESVENE